jgi:hypothetical protein
VDETCIKIQKQGDLDMYERVLALIADRYAHGRYRTAEDGERADVEVRVTPPEFDPIYVVDARRHTVLQRRFWSEFGNSRVEPEGWRVDDMHFAR